MNNLKFSNITMPFKKSQRQEKVHFGICVESFKKLTFYYFHVTLIVFIISIDTCICNNKQFDNSKLHGSLRKNVSLLNVHSDGRSNLKSLGKCVDQHSFEMDSISGLPNDNEINVPAKSIDKIDSRKVPFTSHRSSQLGNLIQLLSQHSSEVLKNNNRSTKDTISKHASILRSLGSFDPLKEGSNISDSYYDILYDYELESDHIDQDVMNESLGDNNVGCFSPHGSKDIDNHKNDKNKK